MRRHLTTIYYGTLVDRCIEAMDAGALRHEAVESVAVEYDLRDDQIEIMTKALFLRWHQAADEMYRELTRMMRYS